MKLQSTKISSVYILDIEPVEDERGFFARVFCNDEFARLGLSTNFLQMSISYNHVEGTLRGLHYQKAPHEETKLIRCTQGAIWDVVVDVRPESPTFKQWIAVELSAANHRAVYLPAGIAHGLQTLQDNTEVLYHITPQYVPEAAQSIRWNDPELGIKWPKEVTCISERDKVAPFLEECLCS